MDPVKKPSSSHLGVGLAVGAAIGLASGLFLQSRQGKQLTKDAQKKALQLQKKVMTKLRDVEKLTKEKYEELVEEVLSYYTKTKEIAAKELPDVRKYLLARWKTIEAEINDRLDA